MRGGGRGASRGSVAGAPGKGRRGGSAGARREEHAAHRALTVTRGRENSLVPGKMKLALSTVRRSAVARGARQTLPRSFHASPLASSNYHPIGQVRLGEACERGSFAAIASTRPRR